VRQQQIEEHILNAPPEMQLRLLELQAIDSQLDQLTHRETHLPEIAELQDIDRAQGAIRDQMVAASTKASDVKREQDKLEKDIDQVRQRMARDQQRLDAGTVSSAKELESLQHEIDSLARRQRDLEDVELEVMESLEEIETDLNKLQTSQNELASRFEDTERRRVDALQAIAKDRAFAIEQREVAVAEISPELLTLYDKLRDQYDGLAAVAIKKRRCEGCRLEINTTDLGRIREAAEDAVLRCEECRRIQVRTPESGL
jgi:predicted  nucleic acid-binding Zn-ribbon protein